MSDNILAGILSRILIEGTRGITLKFRQYSICIVLCLLYVLLFPVWAIATIKLGVLANTGATATIERWTALADYLSKRLDEEVYILPLGFDVIEQAVEEDGVDFLLANPFFFVTIREKYNARAISTLIAGREDQLLQQYGGVLFVRKESQVYRLSDIKGKDLMTVSFSSCCCYMIYRLLLDNGLDPRHDPSSLVEGITHENVVLAVAHGLIDVGAIRTGTLEHMVEDGKIRLEDFRVIHRLDDAFPFVHSTRLYPEWPMVALAHVPDRLVTAMQHALVAMDASSPAARQAGIIGWQNPVSYAAVREVVQIIEQSLQ